MSGGNIGVAEDLAAAVNTPSLIETADVRRDLSVRTNNLSAADRAERGIQLLSRWAGILAFAGALAGIVWLIL